jgi:hypothetical protein
MSSYKKEIGTAVQNYAGDPDNPITGQLWYDSNASEFKYQEQVTGSAWSTGNSMNTARSNLSGSGTQTAALAFAGSTGPGGTVAIANTEQYDGTSWTEVNDVNTARRSGAGTGNGTTYF